MKKRGMKLLRQAGFEPKTVTDRYGRLIFVAEKPG